MCEMHANLMVLNKKTLKIKINSSILKFVNLKFSNEGVGGVGVREEGRDRQQHLKNEKFKMAIEINETLKIL